jgi:hypothetical protein
MYGCALLANTGGICGVTIASVQLMELSFLEHMRDDDSAKRGFADGCDKWSMITWMILTKVTMVLTMYFDLVYDR